MSIESGLSPLRSDVFLPETRDRDLAIPDKSSGDRLCAVLVALLGGLLTLFGATVLGIGGLWALSSLIRVL